MQRAMPFYFQWRLHEAHMQEIVVVSTFGDGLAYTVLLSFNLD
jgi:hypothetical protein